MGLQVSAEEHAEDRRDRKAEVSEHGESEGLPAAGQRRKSKATKGSSEVDELFGKLKQARANGKAEQAQVLVLPQRMHASSLSMAGHCSANVIGIAGPLEQTTSRKGKKEEEGGWHQGRHLWAGGWQEAQVSTCTYMCMHVPDAMGLPDWLLQCTGWMRTGWQCSLRTS
jgi:hypothetical protein